MHGMFIWMPPTEAPDTRSTPDKEPENRPSIPDFFALPDIVPSRAVRDLAGTPLRWVVQIKGNWNTCEMRCQLRHGEEVLGLLRYETLSRWDPPEGMAWTKEGTWSFRGWGTEVAIETDKGDRTLIRPYGRRLFRGPS